MAENGRQKKVVLFLAAGLTIRRAAQKAGAGERTVYRWLQDEAFRQRIAELRTQMFHRAVGRLAHGCSKAAFVLGGLLDSQDERIKLTAAKAILETGIKARDALELLERVENLEKYLSKKEQTWR